MHRVAAKVAQEVAVLLEHHHIDAGAREQEAEHHAGRPAAGYAAAGRDVGHLFGGQARRVSGNRGALSGGQWLRPPAMLPFAEQRLQLWHHRVGEQARIVFGQLLAHVAEL